MYMVSVAPGFQCILMSVSPMAPIYLCEVANQNARGDGLLEQQILHGEKVMINSAAFGSSKMGEI